MNKIKRGDGFLHCWVSCKVASWCPVPNQDTITLIVGALKEIADIVIGESEMRDFLNDVHGVGCSHSWTTSCWDCCDKLDRGGKLAEAAPATDGEPTAVASRGEPGGGDGLTGANAAALA